MSIPAIEKQKIFNDIARVTQWLPTPIYWLDKDAVLLAGNKHFYATMGIDENTVELDKFLYNKFPHEVVQLIIKNEKEVILSGNDSIQEEITENNLTGEKRSFTVYRSPVRDEDGFIIGLVGTLVETTAEKKAKKLRLENDNIEFNGNAFTRVTQLLPTPIYWLSADTKLTGANKQFFQTMGITPEAAIGTTGYDVYPYDIAKHIVEHDLEVMRTGKPSFQEEPTVDLRTGTPRYFRAHKAPFRNEKGDVIGLVGTLIEITVEKEAQQLKLESERQQIALLEEKEKLIALAQKVAHDIGSPLAALSMVVNMCEEITEDKRKFINKAVENILDIANNLLNTYRNHEDIDILDIEPHQSLLVSDLLIQLLSEKKAQYRDRSVTFNTVIAHDAQFAFIQCQATEFRRAMSNLINNAVDALEGKVEGIVTIQLAACEDTVVIEITDNGCGMPAIMTERMRRRRSFTSGKENGHGLGLQQVWDMLEYNDGILQVESTLRQGTSIKLTFIRAAAPSWIAQEIQLTPQSIIVILDDDQSIHAAWTLRFTPMLNSYPAPQLHHFTQGQEVLDFVEKMSGPEKNKVVFLSDYELLHQERNGLQIIESSAVNHTILVTSYYGSPKIREASDRLKIKILPKQMASIIPIYVD